MRGLPRPGVPERAGVVLAAMAAVLFLIGRTTGSGWLVVVFCGLVGVLAVSLVTPLIHVMRATAAAHPPTDATVGRPAPVGMEVDARRPGLQMRLLDPLSGWVRVDGLMAGDVLAVPARRGVAEEIRAEVRSAAPLGLFSWKRTLTVPLTRPLEVGPAPAEVKVPGASATAVTERAGTSRPVTSGELVAGVRDYEPGDPMRLVSWASSARHGRLMVRELETPHRPRLVVVVDLSHNRAGVVNRRGRRDPGDDRVEEAASRAAGLAVAALARGMPVVMATAEADGPRSGPVRSAGEAGRRLARAVAGAPAVPDVLPGDVVTRVELATGVEVATRAEVAPRAEVVTPTPSLGGSTVTSSRSGRKR